MWSAFVMIIRMKMKWKKSFVEYFNIFIKNKEEEIPRGKLREIKEWKKTKKKKTRLKKKKPKKKKGEWKQREREIDR